MNQLTLFTIAFSMGWAITLKNLSLTFPRQFDKVLGKNVGAALLRQNKQLL